MPPSVFVPIHERSLLLCCRPQRSHRGEEKTCVYSMWDHAPKAVAAGDELCTSYECGSLHPLPQMACIQRSEAFLLSGFVPFEHLPARRSKKE